MCEHIADWSLRAWRCCCVVTNQYNYEHIELVTLFEFSVDFRMNIWLLLLMYV